MLHSPNLHQLFILTWSTDATWWFVSLTYISRFSDQDTKWQNRVPVMVPITVMSSFPSKVSLRLASSYGMHGVRSFLSELEAMAQWSYCDRLMSDIRHPSVNFLHFRLLSKTAEQKEHCLSASSTRHMCTPQPPWMVRAGIILRKALKDPMRAVKSTAGFTSRESC